MRKILWFVKIALCLVSLLALGSFAWTAYAYMPKPVRYDAAKKTTEVYLGYFSDCGVGQRTAIQQIAAMMRHYPAAENYRVHFDIGVWPEDIGRVVDYDRSAKQILQGDYLCGCGCGWADVTDEAVQMVASQHGLLDDFKKMGGSSFP